MPFFQATKWTPWPTFQPIPTTENSVYQGSQSVDTRNTTPKLIQIKSLVGRLSSTIQYPKSELCYRRPKLSMLSASSNVWTLGPSVLRKLSVNE